MRREYDVLKQRYVFFLYLQLHIISIATLKCIRSILFERPRLFGVTRKQENILFVHGKAPNKSNWRPALR